jgi:hypothetical protein
MIVSNGVTTIAAGAYHSLFLKNDGSLWGMGYNSDGELGNGTFDYSVNVPAQIVSGGVTAMAVGCGNNHSLFVEDGGSLWGMGDNSYGQLGEDILSNTNQPGQILAAYNQIYSEVLSGGDWRFSFVGIAETNYVLERSFSLSPPGWVPQATNSADSIGVLMFTNQPDAAPNNFWRIHSVP